MKYGYNTSFLNNNDELSAYFLGFYVADGWMSTINGKYIRISSTDEQIISDLAVATSYTNKIVASRNHSYGGAGGFTGTTQYHLSYCGPVFRKIVDLGFTVNKTGSEFIPLCVSDSTFCHFVRGLSDGDGSFGIYKVKQYDILKYSLTSASPEFLASVLDKLKELSIVATRGKVRATQTAYDFSLGHADSVRLGEWIYRDASIRLKRKYDIWLAGTKLPRTRRTWTRQELEMVRLDICPPGRTQREFYMKRWHLSH